MEKNTCRLCGKERNISNLLRISSDIKFKIENYCRIDVNDNKTLPQRICFDCNYVVANFASFSENAREIQTRLLRDNNLLVEVKVEAFESMPVIECFMQDVKEDPTPSSKRKTRSSEGTSRYDETSQDSEEEKSVEDMVEDQNFMSSGSESDNSSDSDYQSSSYKKRKVEKPTPKVKSKRGRKPKSQRVFDNDSVNEAVELDVSDCDRNDDGTISISAQESYNDQRWCDMRLTCTECDYTVKGPYGLKLHYADQHSTELNEVEKYRCVDCKDTDEGTVDALHKYVNHVVKHRPFLKFCCLVCSTLFWNLDALHQHYQSNHKDVPSFHFCLLCGQFFKASYYLTSHETRLHKVQVCREDGEIKIPGQVVITVDTLFADELANDEVDADSIFRLPESEKNADGTVTKACQKRFEGRTWTSIPMKCTACQLKLPSAFKLWEHLGEKHSNIRIRNYVCESCPQQKTFFYLESFVNHTFTIHVEHLKYFCFVCNEIFWNYKALYQHFKATHEDYRANICLYCGKYHKSGYDLKCHKEVHLSRAEKGDEAGNFKCNQCPKTYRKHIQLQRHLETHKNERTWICETCGQSFKTKSTLINHYMGKLFLRLFEKCF